MLQTKIQNTETAIDEVHQSLLFIGEYIAKEIIGHEFVKNADLVTCEDCMFHGLTVLDKPSLIISSKEDYDYFAKGVSNLFPNCKRGYIDFDYVDGREITKSLFLPGIGRGERIDTVIIAKSVIDESNIMSLLLKKVVEKYIPKYIIIATAFYNKDCINRLVIDVPKCEFFVCDDSELNHQKEKYLTHI